MTQLIIFFLIGLTFYYVFRSHLSYMSVHQRPKKSPNSNSNETSYEQIRSSEVGMIVALIAKVAKADGRVSELEAELISNTLTDIAKDFSDSENVRIHLKQIFKEEKENPHNVKEIATAFYYMTRFDGHKRLKILEYLINLAFIDKVLTKEEEAILALVAKQFKIGALDFLKLMNDFKSYYASANTAEQTSLEQAYKTLESHVGDDFKTIKNNYRKLVKIYHPDVRKANNESEESIVAATKKLQEINNAYELVKKHLKA